MGIPGCSGEIDEDASAECGLIHSGEEQFMKKLFWFRVMKLLALAIPAVLVVLLVQNWFFFRVDYNTARLKGFYAEPKNSLDVVFIGASDVFTGFSPADAYDQFGFTSYMYAVDSNSASMNLACLKEILKYQDPQWIIVEVNGYLYDREYMAQESPIRDFAECAPWSVNKVETILSYPIEDKISCFFPFILYHGEFGDDEARRESFQYRKELYGKQTLLKGVLTDTETLSLDPVRSIQNDFGTQELEQSAIEALMGFLDFCKNEGIDNILFVRFPHRVTVDWEYTSYQRSNMVGRIVTEQGYTFLSLEQCISEIGLEYDQDFYDNDHLNIYGQEKLTRYLGALLWERYVTAPMKQTPKNRAQWDLAVEYIHQYNKQAKQMKRYQISEQLWEYTEMVDMLTHLLKEESA